MRRILRAAGPLGLTAAILVALIAALHAPVFTRGALVTPAGMHYAQWPWKPYARETVARGAMLQENSTLSDVMFQVYPWQLYTIRSLQGGWIPLWNPYSYCGVPFVANAQSAVFYPLHWPAWVLPSMRVFTAAILMKILLAGLFMAIFLRGLGCSAGPCALGAVSFALCGFMTSWLGYAHTNAALLLPLLMHAARLLAVNPSTGGFLLLAFASAAQYLGGHPETSLHIVGAAFLYLLWGLRESPRPRLAFSLFAGASALGFAMAAVQMLPFVEYLRGSAALAQRQVLPGMDPSLPADAPLALLLPTWFGRTVDGTFHGPVVWQAMASYAGAGVLLLAVVSLWWWRQSRFFAGLAALSALVVYGQDAVRAALRLVPVVGISSNNRLLLLLSFCLAVMAALALEGIVSGGAGAGRAGPLAIMLAGAAGALAVIAATSHGAADPIGARLAAFFVAGTAILSAMCLMRRSSRGIYLIGIVAITAVDMLQFAMGFNPHADPSALFRPTKLTDFLRQDAAGDMARGGRLMTVGWVMRPETQMPYWLSSIEGYDAMEFADYRHLLDRAEVARIHETGEIPARSRPLLDLLGLRYVVTPPGGVVSGERMRVAYDGPDGRVFVNETARARLSFVPRARAMPPSQRRRVIEDLASGSVGLDDEVLIESDGPGDEAGEVSGGRPALTLTRNAPGALGIAVGGHEAPGWLVVSDAYDDGWRATVNGRDARLVRANGVFMAIPLPAGEAEVALTYRPLSFRVGAWISGLSLLFAIIAGLVRFATTRPDRGMDRGSEPVPGT